MRARDTLAITADVATILGVSMVGFIGTPLVSTLLGRKFSVSDFINGVLFYFIMISAGILVSTVLLKLVGGSFKQRKYFNMTFHIFLFILSLSILCGVFGPSKNLWANLFANEYFFPEYPSSIVESLDLRFNENNGDLVGQATWKQQYKPIDIDNYRVVTYLEYSNDSLYEVHRFFSPIHGGSSETELARISTDGSFLIPNVSKRFRTQGNVLQGFIVAIVTRLDSGLRRRYPAGVSDKNATELNAIGAFAEGLDVRGAQP